MPEMTWTPRPVDITNFDIVQRHVDPPANILDAVSEITDLCFVPENPTPSDVIFVYGAKPRSQYIDKVRSAIENGISKTIILTGGISSHDTNKDQEAESDIVERHIRDCKNYSDMTVYKDNTSGYSFENITNAQKIFDFSGVQTISVIGLHYASQRQLQTLKSYLPDKEFYYLPYQHMLHDHLVTADTWHLHEDSRRLIWGEVIRLYQYDDQSYIKLDDNVREKVRLVFKIINTKQ